MDEEVAVFDAHHWVLEWKVMGTDYKVWGWNNDMLCKGKRSKSLRLPDAQWE